MLLIPENLFPKAGLFVAAGMIFGTVDFEKITTMDLPKVIIKENYGDYLNGKEVEATVVSEKKKVEKGMHVMGFHNSIAVNTALTVPREKQTHYIGVEGMVTEIHYAASSDQPEIKVVKI